MNGNNGDNDRKDDTDLPESGEMPDIGGDTIVDVAGELKVDELVRKIDATDPDEAAHKREVRKRVEEARERHEQDLDSTFNFNLDDEL